MENRATFKFFRSFYEAAANLEDKDQQADFLMAICGYALDGKEPDIQGIPAALFLLAKPNLDASRAKAESGFSGGSASKTEANDKQTESKTQANRKQTGSKREANRKQMSSKTEANDKQTASEVGSRKKEVGSKEVGGREYTPPFPPEESTVQLAENVSMTNDEYQKLLAAYGTADTARLIEILDNYKGASGKKYKSDYRAILNWCINRLMEEKKKTNSRSGNVFMDMLRQEGGNGP